jgi:O-antigen/teichoic acid export membrane protein
LTSKAAGIARSLWKSSALRAGLALGFSGVMLACGNLILARILPTVEFSRFALFYAVAFIGINVGPFGADVIMTRRQLHPGRILQRQVFLYSTVIALILAAIARVVYQFDIELIGCLLVSIVAGSVKVVPSSYYRSQQRFGPALLLTMSTNAAILVSVIAAFAFHTGSALIPAAAMTATLCLTAWLGWRAIAATVRGGSDRPQTYPMSEAWSTVSFIAAGMILSSLDRLIAPTLLGLSALATLSVLATIAGSPYQVLHQAIGYTLVPALRNAGTRAARIQALVHEGLIVSVLCLAASFCVWWLTPLLAEWVLAGRYPLSAQLLMAAIALGLLKVYGSLAAAAVTAFGSSADLARLSFAGWLSIGTSLIGGWAGSRFGIVGLVYGVASGWLLRALLMGWLAYRQLTAESAQPEAGLRAWEKS